MKSCSKSTVLVPVKRPGGVLCRRSWCRKPARRRPNRSQARRARCCTPAVRFTPVGVFGESPVARNVGWPVWPKSTAASVAGKRRLAEWRARGTACAVRWPSTRRRREDRSVPGSRARRPQPSGHPRGRNLVSVTDCRACRRGGVVSPFWRHYLSLTVTQSPTPLLLTARTDITSDRVFTSYWACGMKRSSPLSGHGRLGSTQSEL